MTWLLALLAVGGTPPYVPMEKVATSARTHICTVGPVVYVRRQDDRDWHITLDNGRVKVVVEIIPLIPLSVPKKGNVIKACGIRRFDDWHKWWEINPAESIEVIK